MNRKKKKPERCLFHISIIKTQPGVVLRMQRRANIVPVLRGARVVYDLGRK